MGGGGGYRKDNICKRIWPLPKCLEHTQTNVWDNITKNETDKYLLKKFFDRFLLYTSSKEDDMSKICSGYVGYFNPSYEFW